MPSSQDKYKPTAWNAEQFVDLEMPSGQLAQVRRPGVQQLIAIGVLENADGLSAIVDKKHIKRVKGKAEIDGQSLLKDPKNILNLMQMVDKITARMVVRPAVREPFVEYEEDGQTKRRPLRDEEREQGVVYTDNIEFTDRMFIFQFAVGGSADLNQFRERFESALGSMEAQQGVSPTPC